MALLCSSCHLSDPPSVVPDSDRAVTETEPTQGKHGGEDDSGVGDSHCDHNDAPHARGGNTVRNPFWRMYLSLIDLA